MYVQKYVLLWSEKTQLFKIDQFQTLLRFLWSKYAKSSVLNLHFQPKYVKRSKAVCWVSPWSIWRQDSEKLRKTLKTKYAESESSMEEHFQISFFLFICLTSSILSYFHSFILSFFPHHGRVNIRLCISKTSVSQPFWKLRNLWNVKKSFERNLTSPNNTIYSFFREPG